MLEGIVMEKYLIEYNSLDQNNITFAQHALLKQVNILKNNITRFIGLTLANSDKDKTENTDAISYLKDDKENINFIKTSLKAKRFDYKIDRNFFPIRNFLKEYAVKENERIKSLDERNISYDKKDIKNIKRIPEIEKIFLGMGDMILSTFLPQDCSEVFHWCIISLPGLQRLMVANELIEYYIFFEDKEKKDLSKGASVYINLKELNERFPGLVKYSSKNYFTEEKKNGTLIKKGNFSDVIQNYNEVRKKVKIKREYLTISDFKPKPNVESEFELYILNNKELGESHFFGRYKEVYERRKTNTMRELQKYIL